MPLSWNEIKSRALAFSKEWEGESSESAEAKSFWDAFFLIYGMKRRRVASFEAPVKKSDGKGGFIDLLWKGVLLVEHKSLGKNLDRAFGQALDYFPGIKDRDLPQYILVSDFARFRLYDLDNDELHEFKLKDLHKNVQLFGFIAGYQTRSFGQEDSVNIKAAEALGKLHDKLLENGYKGHALEVFLVRLLFCLFAEDTGIFERKIFQDYIEQRTNEDGSDLGMHLFTLFQVLDREENERQKNLDEQLVEFPYIDGKLFEESLPVPAFSSGMREILIDCCSLDWSRISPAIFGSLFQSIMDKEARRNLGAHYTSETNILKALKPLFLDNLYAEFKRIKSNQKKLIKFHVKLGNIKILDPACGCGNFLVVAYRELRLLELKLLRLLYKKGRGAYLNIEDLILLNVDQFYGIEIEEFPAQIAQAALWLTDHQMNLKISEEFGQYFVRLPLSKTPNIFIGNALKYNWEEIIDPKLLNFIVGNPPFLGKKEQSSEQKDDVSFIFSNVNKAGILDYVACWYKKAAVYIRNNSKIKVAFVSTNSITQGEQVSVLWQNLIAEGVIINFAHKTFEWTNEARGKAAVHVVIIGFSIQDNTDKFIFEYESLKSEPHVHKVNFINSYLADAPNVFLENRSTPICDEPTISYGSFALDDGNFTLSPADRKEILKEAPKAKRYIRSFIGGRELIRGEKRYCLWLKDAALSDLRKIKPIKRRINAVKEWRNSSKRATTKKLASTPSVFAEIRQPYTDYIAFPTLSSVNRTYIPIKILSKKVIASNQIYVISDTSIYHFGVLTSAMHMAWTRSVCGRFKSDYRYSAGIVYNNFPWPEPNDKQRENIETAAQLVLDERSKIPDATLADIYDPLATPQALIKAHEQLDKAVDAAYRKKRFNYESERVSHLFELYSEITADLIN